MREFEIENFRNLIQKAKRKKKTIRPKKKKREQNEDARILEVELLFCHKMWTNKIKLEDKKRLKR